MTTCPTRRGGTLPELLAGAAALTLLGALILPGAARMRAESRTASSLSQLRWIAGVTSSYGADNADRFWSYSWKAGPLPHSDPTLPVSASSDLNAAAIQAIDLLHRRGRPDIPAPAAWIPHPNYNHLPLLDYLDHDMPDFKFISPADRYRLAWARDPDAFDRGEFLPYQPSPHELARTWPYSASYHFSSAFYDQGEVGRRISQGSTYRSYITSSSSLGGALAAGVAFPAEKVFLSATEQREYGSVPRFSLHEAARVAMLMADGAARFVATAEVNPGWKPNDPTSPEPSRFTYGPSLWEAPTTTGEPTETVTGYFRWTRGGIGGRDFGGPEVDTGQP